MSRKEWDKQNRCRICQCRNEALGCWGGGKHTDPSRVPAGITAAEGPGSALCSSPGSLRTQCYPLPACGLGSVMSYCFSLQFSFSVLIQFPGYCSQKSAKAGMLCTAILGIILPFARPCLKSRDANVLATPYRASDKGVVVGVYLNLNCFLHCMLLRLRQLFVGREKALSDFICIFQNPSTVHPPHLGLCSSLHVGKHSPLVLITTWCLDMLKTLKQL